MCSLLTSEGANQVYVDVEKAGCRQGKVAQWSYCMAGDFEALAGLASTRPGAAILLHAWPHKTLSDQLYRCSGARVRQIEDELEHLEP
jgi:hypothetical protein